MYLGACSHLGAAALESKAAAVEEAKGAARRRHVSQPEREGNVVQVLVAGVENACTHL